MAKALTLKIDNKEYTLEYTRKTYLDITKQGLNLGKTTKLTQEDVLTQLPLLFYGAFLAHYPEITLEEANEILDKVEGKTNEFWQKLIELYAEPVNSLIDSNKKPKNKNWGANW